jgi:hypothetical protein
MPDPYHTAGIRRGPPPQLLREPGQPQVDVPWFDYASLPIQVQVPSPTDRERLITAGLAWGAATCWVGEPAYAARCLAELFQRLGHLPTLNPDRVVSFPCTVYLLLTSHSVRGS